MLLIEFSPNCEDDLRKLCREDAKFARKLWELILDINRDPFHGLGQPELLRGDLLGWYSRRISEKHRLVYKVEAGLLKIAPVMAIMTINSALIPGPEIFDEDY